MNCERLLKMPRKVKYIKCKAWQRSCRDHPVRSRCRHARRRLHSGIPFKGGR